MVVLIGMMGTGKSTVAKILAEMLDCDMFDTDRMVEASHGRGVREVFATMGEDAFREEESRQLALVLSGDGRRVVAAAGGAVLRESNRTLLNSLRRGGSAVVVWLTADEDTILGRTSRSGHRPLLDDDPRSAIARITTERESLYAEVADIRIDTTGVGPRSVADSIVATLARIGGWVDGKNE